MHDEANPGFADMIDQTTLGHRLLKQQFGIQPKTTWQIDPCECCASAAPTQSRSRAREPAPLTLGPNPHKQSATRRSRDRS